MTCQISFIEIKFESSNDFFKLKVIKQNGDSLHLSIEKVFDKEIELDNQLARKNSRLVIDKHRKNENMKSKI